MTKHKRSRDFLENAFERARRALNPRDFAVIFQAARAHAGGKKAARNRQERAAERMLIDKARLEDMNKAELQDFSLSLDKAYERNTKSEHDVRRVLTLAQSLQSEFRRRGFKDPDGRVYVELSEAVAKGFVNGTPEGGMHAHGLDRRNSKTLDDGGHLHIWAIEGTGQILTSNEDGLHAHEIDGGTTATDGAHSHKVMLPSGEILETRLDGKHSHGLMVETSGFDGDHNHTLVMPDGTELPSMTVKQFVERMDAPPSSAPLPFASEISEAMRDLRHMRSLEGAGAPLPGAMPNLDAAVEMCVKGSDIPLPVLTVADDEGDLVDVRIGGEVLGYSRHAVADSPLDMAKAAAHWELLRRHTSEVPFSGPVDAKLLFVAAAPNELELARKQALVGDDSLTFEELYLKPLGLLKRDVALGFVMPTLPHQDLNAAMCEKWGPHLVAAMKTYSGAKIVALGRVAREVLKSQGIKFWSLPHPSAIRKKGDRGEITRKLKTIAKALDKGGHKVRDLTEREGRPSKGPAPGTLADAISEMRKTGSTTCRVVKSDGEKQVVYGVVLDPYDVDLQAEWVPPAEVESTAHGFLKKSRVIGFEHTKRAEAAIVESWIEVYPSQDDYKAALENRSHKVFRRKFGDDVIHSGTWMAGVQLGDKEWALHKQGKLNAFSVGGFSFKAKVTTAAMPKVEFIELVEQ